jgi:hypothetical protein
VCPREDRAVTDPSDVITEDDFAGLNERALLRVVDVARRGSFALLVLAGVIALAWIWQTLRFQGVIDDSQSDRFSLGLGDQLSAKQRLDALTTTITMLGFAGLVAGLGLGLRVYCEATTLRAGGSLTGWNVGDRIDDEDGGDGPDLVELDPD